MPPCAGGGAQFSPNTRYGDGRSTQHSRWVIRPTWRTATNFIFYTNPCSTWYFTILFWDWGRRQIAGINSWQYTASYYDVSSTVRCLLTSMLSASLYYISSTVCCLPHCVIFAQMYDVCHPCMMSGYLYNVCLSVWCLPTCMMSSYLYDVLLSVWRLLNCMMSV
jgi:hypothetical protein